MNATKKLAAALLFLIIASVLTIGGLIKEKKTTNNNRETDLILYYGNTCPHCKIVEDYLAKNGPNSKLDIAQKEVYQNQDNQKEFIGKATACKLDLNSLGVPMLWDAPNSKCYVGDQPIIDFLNTKLLKE